MTLYYKKVVRSNVCHFLQPMLMWRWFQDPGGNSFENLKGLDAIPSSSCTSIGWGDQSINSTLEHAGDGWNASLTHSSPMCMWSNDVVGVNDEWCKVSDGRDCNQFPPTSKKIWRMCYLWLGHLARWIIYIF